VREAEEVKGLRLAQSLALAIRSGEAAELDQPRLALIINPPTPCQAASGIR
jgi:hypothetical protein